MKKEEVLRKLAGDRDRLRAMGVRSLALFGSVARDEARPDSDVDLLIEVEPPLGLLGLVRIQHHLEDVLGARVDIVTREGLHPALRQRILAEAQDVPWAA